MKSWGLESLHLVPTTQHPLQGREWRYNQREDPECH